MTRTWVTAVRHGVAGFVLEDRHFAEDVAFLEDIQKSLGVFYDLGDTNFAFLEDEQFVARFVLEEDELIRFVDVNEAVFFRFELEFVLVFPRVSSRVSLWRFATFSPLGQYWR